MEEGNDDEYVFFGTPIADEQELFHPSQRRKADPAATRQLPLWKQASSSFLTALEPTDAQGRRRFHGAFTGGFSAGYFNSVGSAEGWAPSAFHSSRSDRAGAQAQRVEQFLDEDELEELKRTSMHSTAQYDTFGFTAAEAAKRAAAAEASQRPSAIPGLLPQEAVTPVAEGVGIKLLQRMGWRQGKGIGGEEAAAGGGGRKGKLGRGWGKMTGVGPENTPLHLITPKNDAHGLGFDPFKGAEEFRAAKAQRTGGEGRLRTGGEKAVGGARSRGVAFGAGVLDEDDSFHVIEDYVTHDHVESYEETAGITAEGLPVGRTARVERAGLGDRLALQGFAYEVQEEEESDEDGAPKGGKRQRRLAGPAAPLALHSAQHAARQSFIPGFVLASDGGIQRPVTYPPPVIPSDYIPVRRPSSHPRPAADQGGPIAPPKALPAVPPPADPALRQEIEQLAFFVAKNGPDFEAVAKEVQRRGAAAAAAAAGGSGGSAVRNFMLGGEGAGFFAWKLATLRAMLAPRGGKRAVRGIGQRSTPLSAEERGEILGEQPLAPSTTAAAGGAHLPPQQAQQGAAAAAVPLAKSLMNVAEEDRKRLQALMGSTFVRAEAVEVLHPDAALQGGLRPGAPPPPPLPPPGATAGASKEAAPPQPPAEPRRLVTVQDLSRPMAAALVSTAAGTAAAVAPGGGLPVRRSEDWRPEPLLCRRMDVPDPFKGRPKEVQMSRFKTDHIALPSTHQFAAAAAAAAAIAALPPHLSGRTPAVAAGTAAPLPPPPPQALSPPAEEEVAGPDASAAAEAFLSSLGGPEGGEAPLEAEAVEEEAAAAAAGAKPLDLFKAIFEESSSEEDEEEEEKDAAVVAGKPGVAAAVAAPAADGPALNKPGGGESTFGFHKFVARDKRMGAAVPAAPGGGGGERGGWETQQPPPAGAAAVASTVMAAEMKERVEAALRVVSESKKHKKRKKEKGEKKERHERKDRKLSKKRKKKSKKEPKKRRRSEQDERGHSHRRRARSSSDKDGSSSSSGR